MSDVDVEFCFYEEEGYAGDADRDSRLLQAWHAQLWSKPLPSGELVEWRTDEEFPCLTHRSGLGDFRLSSDTIATTHASYSRSAIPAFWAELSSSDQARYEDGFYRISGFIVFPRHERSLNQLRGSRAEIADRFDLTLDCIRRHYLGSRDNPLGDVLRRDAAFFGLFGTGPSGFSNYVEFFFLQDLVDVDDDSIRWFDGFKGASWDFGESPLPKSSAVYRTYLHNVLAFVTARGARIAEWCASEGVSST